MPPLRMECAAAGALPSDQAQALLELLVGLAGHAPAPVQLHEATLRCAAPPGGDLVLRRSTPAADAQPGPWSALQYGEPLRERQLRGETAATVRSVRSARCAGADVPSFWQGLGFAPRHESLRRGSAVEVQLAGHLVQVRVCQLLRLPPAGDGGWAARLAGAEEVTPGLLLVEALATVPDGAQIEAVVAIGSLAALLAPLVTLGQLPAAPKGY